jgi:energy-coupling factor transport system permease protein
LSPEIKIILYLVFISCLFLISDITVYLFILFAIALLLLRIPFKSLKSGWIPISLFLLFTFISNVFFQYGRILYSVGPLVITEEGLSISASRTMRVFFMIAGAKALTATTQIELLAGAFGKILKPLERLGIPVDEFFSTMGLTMKSLSGLKDQLADTYKEMVNEGNIKGFGDRAKVISKFLMSLLVKSMQAPEIFFKESSRNETPTSPTGEHKGE